MAKISLEKLKDFFRHYDDNSPQKKEAIKRLYDALEQDAPGHLEESSYWITAWRTRPTPAPTPPAPPSPPAKVSVQKYIKIQAQHTSKSCGQTCVAMVINYLGKLKKPADDYWVDRYYGYNLLGALNDNCGGKKWADVGNFKSSMWDAISHNLSKGLPGAIVGLNGPEFSPSGYGHILMIVSIDGNSVGLADPNGGVWRTVTKQLIETCPAHTEGKFVFMVAQ